MHQATYGFVRCPAPAGLGCRSAQPPARRQLTRVHVASVERPSTSSQGDVPPVSEEVAAKMAELGYDLETSGLKYLSNDARVGCLFLSALI
jgi:hypothetical protein